MNRLASHKNNNPHFFILFSFFHFPSFSCYRYSTTFSLCFCLYILSGLGIGLLPQKSSSHTKFCLFCTLLCTFCSCYYYCLFPAFGFLPLHCYLRVSRQLPLRKIVPQIGLGFGLELGLGLEAIFLGSNCHRPCLSMTGLYFWGGKWQIPPGPQVKFSRISQSLFKKITKKCFKC